MAASDGLLGALERWRGAAFLVGGLLMAVDAAFVAGSILTGADRLLMLGQAFVGAAWTAALLGLLGLYPALSAPSRWLSRAGAVFAAVGIATFASMTIAVLVYAAGIPAGTYDAVSLYFIPGVLVGSVLGFVAFGLANLRASIHTRGFGLLLVVPALLVVTNILRFVAGIESTTVTLGIVIADALAMLAIGYLLQRGRTHNARQEVTAADDYGA